MSDQPLVQYASRTDVGMRRAANQDSLAVKLCNDFECFSDSGHLFVVADGMGGHSVGDLASRIAVETVQLSYFKIDAESIPDRILASMTAANRAISDKARENPEFSDMGTTCSLLALSATGACVGHVGDSRVYRVRSGRIEQLTFDHSLQWEMIRAGRATIENVDLLHPRNVITRCLGPDQSVQIDIEGPFHVQSGDRFVLCSDGLTGHVSDSEIGAVASSLAPAEASRLLINLANCRGGADNVTAIVVDVRSYPAVSSPVVDHATKEVSFGRTTDALSKKRSRRRISEWSLVLFSFLATFGLAALALGHNGIGLSIICVALILGFFRLVASIGVTASGDGAVSTPILGGSGMPLPVGSLPAQKSPYRTSSAEVTPDFLEFLAEAQSELTQAAIDNGWPVDPKALQDLRQQSIDAVKKNDPGRCVQLRATAIDVVMKELYHHTRTMQG